MPPDWVVTLIAVIITALVAPVVKDWLGRRKISAETRRADAEADSESADAQLALVQSYKLLVADLRQEQQSIKRGWNICREELRNEKEVSALLYEQNIAIMGQNTALTAKLAIARGVDVLNDKELPAVENAE